MAGLVHFSNFFKYMETAGGIFSRRLVSTSSEPSRRIVGWPRVRAECKFSAPLRFGDTIDIHIAVKTVSDRSIDFQFRIFKRAETGPRIQCGKQCD